MVFDMFKGQNYNSTLQYTLCEIANILLYLFYFIYYFYLYYMKKIKLYKKGIINYQKLKIT